MTAIPSLFTERLTLRAPRLGDFEAMAGFLASGRARYVGGPYIRRDAWRALAAMIGHWDLRGHGMWALEETATGTYLGNVGLHDPEGWIAPEIGWWIVSDTQEGRGFAREGAHAARRYAYEVVGWPAAYSVIHPDNARSIALAERLGAVPDRKQEIAPGELRIVYRHPAPEAQA